jgi:hypothetical protein
MHEQEGLTKSGCLEGYTMFVSLDSNYSTLQRVEKRVEMGQEAFIGWGMKFDFFYL